MILPISLPAMMAAVNTTSSLPPNLRGSLSKDKKVASVFQPAADLDVFRNTDQARFEWVNSSEIQAGQATCGFLKSPWGWPVGSTSGFHEPGDRIHFPIAKVCEYCFVKSLLIS